MLPLTSVTLAPAAVLFFDPAVAGQGGFHFPGANPWGGCQRQLPGLAVVLDRLVFGDGVGHWAASLGRVSPILLGISSFRDSVEGSRELASDFAISVPCLRS